MPILQQVVILNYLIFNYAFSALMLLVGRQDNHASTPPLSFLQAANPQTKPVDLGCESAENWQLSSTSTIAIIIITQLVG